MREPPRQEIPYSIIEASDMEWIQSGTGTLSAIAHTVRVDFQHRTITLPAGKFDLDNFLHIAKDICLRLP